MDYKKIYLFLLCLITSSFCFAFNPDWFKPFPAFRIAGNLYYVGTKDLASYLIVTPKGNILINSDYEENVPMIKQSIEKLGFNFNDIKIILTNQMHGDHAAGTALIKEKTGAQFMVMDGDVSVAESGGKTDFYFSNDSSQHFKAVKVDRILHDGDQVILGNATLVAHLTAGHTKGCTTWTMKVNEKGKIYNVVIVGGATILSDTKLINNPQYPNIIQDYEHNWKVSKALPCDIFLGGHGGYFGLIQKYSKLKTSANNPFIDPEGYQKFIVKSEQNFREELAKQHAALTTKSE